MRQQVNHATGQGRIFVLGDSGTGMAGLHDFFVKNGVSSINGFMHEAGQTDPIHADEDGNRKRFLEYLSDVNISAFSDYPTRYFFNELYEMQPEARFILTTTFSTESWRNNMDALLRASGVQADLDQLCLSYEKLNQEIETLYSRGRKFLKIAMDGSADGYSSIASFLGWQDDLPIVKEDAFAGGIGTRIWSERHKMYAGDGLAALEAIQSQNHDSKAVISEFGWCYLAGDTNSFFEQQFGIQCWDGEQQKSARSVLGRRVEALDELGVRYMKFIVPEKSIIYPEYLPKALSGLETVPDRPAKELESFFPDHVFYLGDSIADAKSYGQLYFRGDTHTNWMGAWVVYRHIIDLVLEALPLARPAISFDELALSIASYDGDLASQLPDEAMQQWRRHWRHTSADGFFETTTHLSLREPAASQVDVPYHLTECFSKRPSLLYERRDAQGPRAVIFRDSTCDFICDYLAEHFSRSLFIWKDGQVFESIIKEERPDIVLHIMAERLVIAYPQFVPLA